MTRTKAVHSFLFQYVVYAIACTRVVYYHFYIDLTDIAPYFILLYGEISQIEKNQEVWVLVMRLEVL